MLIIFYYKCAIYQHISIQYLSVSFYQSTRCVIKIIGCARCVCYGQVITLSLTADNLITSWEYLTSILGHCNIYYAFQE